MIRKPLPGTAMARGVKGRKRIVAYFSEQIPIRRAKGGGDDLFSQLCHATHEDGALLSTQDIVDHMSFLMMAAHDTLTSSLTSFVGELAANPEWQQKLRDEVNGARRRGRRADQLRQSRSHAADRDGVQGSAAAEAAGAVDAAPRGHAISPSRATRFRPAPWSASIRCSPTTCRRSGPIRKRSIRMRFTDEAQRNRHRFAWVPFGGGAHMCLGLHFAYMQAKCFARHFLQNLEVSLEPGYTPDWQMWPIPKPRDGLRVMLKAI